jgi:hypothetical protein
MNGEEKYRPTEGYDDSIFNDVDVDEPMIHV